ncbi:nuclear pore protein 84/107 [Protomyces lactucae-debilis]|uniref:Nuclear pore complex protein n=1 Tax=Protomyces lactucae-debilis TaxID=2754530 RepID=A0A1Y2EV15_PROLT|nr:nuclear pore protein 84/107 [Protomyces lactucae-debilis]ORY75418.1 nuclear pore protein 84/107 [Protomyces lactucae-debilis]
MIAAGGFSMRPSKLREVLTHEQEAASDTQAARQEADDSMQEDTPPVRVVAAGQTVYELGSEMLYFADILERHAGGQLFGERGLLARYYSIGQDKLDELAELEQDGADTNTTHLREQWELECRTWDLVQRLYLERTREIEWLEAPHPYVSNHALELLYYNNDHTASEQRIVLDWLRDGSTAATEFQVRGNRWFYTKEHLLNRKRMGKLSQDDGTVTELDPDAPYRQGKKLAPEDDAFERRLLRQLFYLVRAGEFEEAAELCRDSGNAWRVASMQGGVEYRDAAIDSLDLVTETEGNPNKALWRRMCFALSQQPGFNEYERALYGALCGDLASVLPVCNTWDDALWAHYNALTQCKVEAHLRSLGRAQFEGSFQISTSEHLLPGNIFEALVRSQEPVVAHQAMHPMRVIQARLVTNQIPELLEDIHQQLKQMQQGGKASVASVPYVIRFVAHLILALRQMDVAIPQEPADAVLQAYAELLASADAQAAVALYAAQLPAAIGIEATARYLTRIEDDEARRQQLLNAEKHGLDVRQLLLRTVELVFETSLPAALPSSTQTGHILDPVSTEDERCVRALEWLPMDTRLQTECMTLGAALFRKLLLAGHVSAARLLEQRLPDSTLVAAELMEDSSDAPPVDEEVKMRSALEYVGYCNLCRGLARYEQWKQLIRNRPVEAGGRRDPVGQRQWSAEVARQRQECVLLLREILEGNWCDPAQLSVDPSQELFAEMSQLRTLYLPQVVLKLHGVYCAQEARDMDAAMALAVLVSEQLTGPMQASGLLESYVIELGRVGAYLA